MERRKGFSLLELMLVVAVALIITSIALPAVRRTITGYQLDSSGHAVASMLQSARMAAIKNNTPYYVQYNVAGVPAVTQRMVIAVPAARFAPLTYQSTDPTVAVADNIVLAAGPGPSRAALETAAGIPVGTGQIGNAAPVGFSSRGEPCLQNGGPWTCTTTPAAFEWFMQNSMTGEWAAVTVTPSGRIRAWRLTRATATWQ